MRDRTTADKWKRSLEAYESGTEAFLSKESMERGFLLLDAFVRFTEPGGAVLDIGCGSGEYGKHGKVEKYVGVDPLTDPAHRFRLVKGVGERLPFKDGTFDCVVTMASLDHCADPRQVMSESRRVLRDQGRLFVALQVVRTGLRFKGRRLLHYLRRLDFRSVFRVARANVGAFIGRAGGAKEYGHTFLFTEKSLIDLVSGQFKIAKMELHDQHAFIVAEK